MVGPRETLPSNEIHFMDILHAANHYRNRESRSQGKAEQGKREKRSSHKVARALENLGGDRKASPGDEGREKDGSREWLLGNIFASLDAHSFPSSHTVSPKPRNGGLPKRTRMRRGRSFMVEESD